MAVVSIDIPNQGVQDNFWKTIFLDDSGNPAFFVSGTSPTAIANNLIVSLLAVATMVSIIWLALSAWSLVASGGDTERYASAKRGVLNAIIGIAVIVAMWSLIAAVRWLARGTIGG